MPRNVEIKARVDDLRMLVAAAAALADQGPFDMVQDDTFFLCDRGRLKLRDFANGTGDLIFYRRADRGGPKASFYVRSPTSSPETLRGTLALAYGEAGRVRKHRTLFLIGRTRVHLDEVEDLGSFVELEVVLNDTDDVDAGIREAHALMARLGITASQLIGGAYIDLFGRIGE
jgi:adenylate cyclase class IV